MTVKERKELSEIIKWVKDTKAIKNSNGLPNQDFERSLISWNKIKFNREKCKIFTWVLKVTLCKPNYNSRYFRNTSGAEKQLQHYR